MEVSLRDWFLVRWGAYFDGAELPIAFYKGFQAGAALATRKPYDLVGSSTGAVPRRLPLAVSAASSFVPV
jgi:hypothetical protein